MPVVPAFDQSTYQVRFEWGIEGLRRLARADVVVVVDVLQTAPSDGTDPIATAAHESGALVLQGGLRNASAVGTYICAEQVRRDRRTSVAVVARGEPVPDRGDLRFAVEDLFGAGAVLDGLIERGLDHTSPEAVAAAESFRSLRGALQHLVSASGSARALRGGPGRLAAVEEAIRTAAWLDASGTVPVFRDGRFVV
ncbi:MULTISPECIES: 2-phosphosulfolactate phosphatase [Bacteria]|uniref:2-phosphosulfolactate phosphatase n=1 Tax=Bacteria TaxID=2 RepID=UPI003C7EA395